jgi:Protein of unknown function (DUF1579)
MRIGASAARTTGMSESTLPKPDPALKRLDPFVGRWSMGHLLGSEETTIRGETASRWLPGGFFLEQHVHMNFMGLEIDSLELIGYDPETNTFPSKWREDGTFSGGWRPNPGADESVNVPYDVGGRHLGA